MAFSKIVLLRNVNWEISLSMGLTKLRLNELQIYYYITVLISP